MYFTEAVYLAMNKAEVPSQEVGAFELKGIPGKIRVFRVPHAPYRVEAPGVEHLARRLRGAAALREPAAPRLAGAAPSRARRRARRSSVGSGARRHRGTPCGERSVGS